MTQTARLYGGSLYDLAAEEQFAEKQHTEEQRTEEMYVKERLVDVIHVQMQQICEIFRNNPDYLRLLKEPSVPMEERKTLIETAFGSQAERYLVNFIKLLCERSLLGEYAGCCEAFTCRYNEENGIVEAVVISAAALSEAQQQALKEELEKVSGKRISLIRKTDARVLAGLRVEMEGRQLDGTVQGRLAGISRKLKEIIV